MEDKTSSIGEFDLALIGEFFHKMPRQGPGCDELTRKALSFVNLPAGARIADLGCGTGAQTKVLAEQTDAAITAIDFLPPMIVGLQRRMEAAGLADRVTGVVGSMDNVPFGPEELDLIWAEGSIYNIGYENGLRYWREFLKPGGSVVVTETCWLSDARPEDLGETYENHPEIDTIANKVRIMQEAGYRPTAHFILPEYCWTENYYAPMKARIEPFLEEQGHSPAAERFVERCWEEIDYYIPNLKYFGYVFFIGEKIE